MPSRDHDDAEADGTAARPLASDRTPAPRASGAPGRRSVDVRVPLVLLPLVVALPLLAYGGFLIDLTAERGADVARSDQAAAQAALQAALQGELRHLRQTLVNLSESPALGQRDVEETGAARLAELVVRSGLGTGAVAILDRGGRVLAEYPKHGEAARVIELAPHQARVFETGAPVLSDLHPSPLDGRLSASIDVPVVRGGQVVRVITGLLDPALLSRTLAAQVGKRDALCTVLDSHRRIVARTRDLERWYGELPSDETLRAAESEDEGWRRFRTRDGNAYLWTWSTIPPGWTVWLGSPARELDDALRRSILQLAAVGLGVLLAAMGGAALLARRIASSVDRIAEGAHRLAEGARAPYRPSGIRQLDDLHRALEEANERVGRALADRNRALDAERAARAVADEHNRSKDLFLGMLSHELRNPLAPIRNSIHVLRHAEAGSEQARRARDVIERQTGHLTRLVEDLLDVTRVARGKIALRREPVELSGLVRNVAEDFRPVLERRGVAFRIDLPEAALSTEAEPTRLAQAVGNLLHNAAKFTRRGDEVTLALRAGADGHAEVEVRDTGAGIEPELLRKLFDPFVQGDRTLARAEGGLGLGLALVKGLVELHGGSVRAESAGKGKGAAFVVRLPLVPAARDEAAGGEARGAPTHAEHRVLVVDDNADGAESLAGLVELLGHRAEVAHDGPSAIAKARVSRPDLVLCDIGLPGMDGYDLARALRGCLQGTRLFAVSGYAQPRDVARALEAGFDGHLAKPLDVEDLRRLLA